MRKTFANRLLLSIGLLGTLSLNQASAQVQLHVSTYGNDASDGSTDSPLATLTEAQTRLRALRNEGSLDNQSAEVLVHGGTYYLESPLNFTEEDSGSEEFPILFRAIDGDVVLSGGTKLTNWQTVTQEELLQRLPADARSQVRCIDLKSHSLDAGKLESRRLHQAMSTAAMELFSSKGRLPRAAWPNAGWANAHVTQSSSSTHLSLPRPIHASDAANVWGHGFWSNDWSDSFERLRVVANDQNAEVSLPSDRKSSAVREGARYRIVNLLSELDSPGEWYVDDASQTLLYWPEENSAMEEVRASRLEHLLSLYDVEYMTWSGFRFETARSMLVEIAGGCDVLLSDCHFAESGNVGVHVFHGHHHQIVNCTVRFTGSSGLRIEGGDRSTLTSCEHVVQGCEVHDFCHDFLGGRPGVALYGVGIHLKENHIHHGPDSAVLLHGNEHRVSSNEIHHVCRETDDTGAIYLSHDPTFRGNTIESNHVHDLGGFSKINVIGIYLDDFASGTTVVGNRIRNVARGIAIGGGRDNIIENNSIEGAMAAIQIDARGTSWAKSDIHGPESRVITLCKKTLAESPAMAEKYPGLGNYLDNNPELPKGNIVRSNTFDSRIGVDLQGFDRNLVVMENNVKRSIKDLAVEH